MALAIKDLEKDIVKAYESGVTLEEAERLAGKFLHAQIQLSGRLKAADLDARMRKSGLKAVKAVVYLEESKKGDKKPTEATLTAMIDSNPVVSMEQDAYDQTEVDKDELQRLYDVFHEAHVYFRGIAKGRFE